MAIPPANRPKGRSVRNLRMVWGFATRYPGRIAIAALALLVAAGAATSVPYGFKLDHRQGLRAGAGKPAPHRQVVRGSARRRRGDGGRDRGPLLFRLLARRAHRRRHPPRRAPQPAAPVARLLRGEPPGRDHVAADGRHHDHRAGGRDDHLGRASQRHHGARLRRHHVRARAEARAADAARRAGRDGADHPPRAARAGDLGAAARTASPTSAPSPAKCSAR